MNTSIQFVWCMDNSHRHADPPANANANQWCTTSWKANDAGVERGVLGPEKKEIENRAIILRSGKKKGWGNQFIWQREGVAISQILPV
jgi:hypothetical protein